MNQQCEDAGFTLLEMLVTLAVISAISTLVGGALVLVRHISSEMVAQEGGNSQVEVAQSILRARIESMRAVPRAGGVAGVVDVEGDDQRLSFYAPPLERDSPNSLQAFRVLRTATGELVLFSASQLADDIDLRDPKLTGWTRTKILDGVQDLSISYFGPGSRAGGAEWQRFWSERNQTPEIIRLRVKFADGDHRSWPELDIRPAVTMNRACKFDVGTNRCDVGPVQ